MSRRKSSTDKASPNQQIWIEVTPEMKRRAEAACEQIVDILVEQMDGPFEALWVLRVVVESMMEKYDIKNMQQMSFPTRRVQ